MFHHFRFGRILILAIIAVALFAWRGWWPSNRPPGGPGGPSPA